MNNKFQIRQNAKKVFENFIANDSKKILFVLGDKFSGKTSFLRNSSLALSNTSFANFKDSKLNSPIIVNLLDNKTFLHKSETSLPKLLQELKKDLFLFLDCLTLKNQNLNEFFEFLDFVKIENKSNLKLVISLNPFNSFGNFILEDLENYEVLNLGFFTENETIEFTKDNYPKLDSNFLYSLTNGNIYYTKLLAEYFTKTSAKEIQTKELLKFLENDSSALNWIWKRFDTTKKAVLYFLVSTELKTKLVEKVCDEVTALNGNLTSNQVLEAISELQTLGLVEENENYLNFTIPFLNQFLLSEITRVDIQKDFEKEFKLTKIHLELGLIQFENEDYIDSVENFKKVLDRQSGNFEAKINLVNALKFYPNTLPEIKLYYFESLYKSNPHQAKEIYLEFINSLSDKVRFQKLEKIAQDFPNDKTIQKSVLEMIFKNLEPKSFEEISTTLSKKLDESNWILKNFKPELNNFLSKINSNEKSDSNSLIPILEKILSTDSNDLQTQKQLYNSYSSNWQTEFSSFHFDNFTKTVNETDWIKENFQDEINDLLNDYFDASLKSEKFDLIIKMYDVVPEFLSPYNFYPFVKAANENSNNKIKDLIEKRKAKGLEKGYKKGFESGKQKGLTKGLDLGEREGYEIGVKEGYQTGFNEGLQKGKAKGMDIGYKKGFQQGRSESRRH
ncbi:MAG: hypothetical protein DWQ06_09360 [Calditrichaeota bacterium]|nr:MAG: hypothetical protein DWQ06_09360 [Calditrichota bacterium]